MSGLSKQQRDEAVQALSVEDAPKFLHLGAVLLAEGDAPGAEGAAEVAATCDPQVCEAWVLLAVARRRRKHWDGAIAAFLKALALRPDAIELWTDLGETYLEVPDYPAAASALRQATELDPESAHPSGRRARALVGRTISLLTKG